MSESAWGLLPARGGSKSIPLKNLVPSVGNCLKFKLFRSKLR